jgi:hypothetical protein
LYPNRPHAAEIVKKRADGSGTADDTPEFAAAAKPFSIVAGGKLAPSAKSAGGVEPLTANPSIGEAPGSNGKLNGAIVMVA